MKRNIQQRLSKKVIAGLLLAMLTLHLLGSVVLADGPPGNTIDGYVWGERILPPIVIVP